MSADQFTEAARAEAEECWPLKMTPGHPLSGPERRHRRIGFAIGAQWARDYLAAQEPRVQHLWRPGESPTAFCGDESARLWESITPEESASIPVCARCYLRAIHEAHDVWAAQDPTEVEKESAMDALGCELRVVENGQSTCDLHGGYATSDDVCEFVEIALSAARDARREETR